ncbi:MAG: hypothetical protein A2157_06415 [Deltaproteobacteria bacterium RBG_16_47_11]|nr:MAG: hypothetical protein A2157_06415 [Deltaproteobacteria bacterium RBG_16_47_11]
MESLYKRLSGKIEFIGINVGINEREKGVRGYVKEKNLTFTIIYDEHQKVTKTFGVMGTPTHIITDRKGFVRYRDAKFPDDIDEHMKELLK